MYKIHDASPGGLEVPKVVIHGFLLNLLSSSWLLRRKFGFGGDSAGCAGGFSSRYLGRKFSFERGSDYSIRWRNG
jgi:hypothetical protein